MHRLAAVPGLPSGLEDTPFVEQDSTPLLVLSSSDTDLQTLAAALAQQPEAAPVRGLNLAALAAPAVLDHYIATSLLKAPRALAPAVAVVRGALSSLLRHLSSVPSVRNVKVLMFKHD